MGNATPAKQTDRQLVQRVREFIKKNSLQAVRRDHYSFASMGTMGRIAKGSTPKRKSLRDKFNLHSLVTVLACTRCDGGHPVRTCRPKNKKVDRGLKVNKDLARTIACMRFFKRRE